MDDIATAPVRSILIFAPHYLPGYRAGGTLRSLAVAVSTARDVRITIVTSDRDLGCSKPYPGLSGRSIEDRGARVLYLNASSPRHWFFALKNIRVEKYDAVYLNSLFNTLFAIVPATLWCIHVIRGRRLIVAPRGQLSPGAMGVGSPLKPWVLGVWRLTSRVSGVIFQAANSHEQVQIHASFPHAVVLERPDPVNLPPVARRTLGPGGGAEVLHAVYVGRVSPVKGLHVLFAGLALVDARVSLRIVGSLADTKYVHHLKEISRRFSEKITVCFVGPRTHTDVMREFADSDVFLFPTTGESFGHVIPEALSNSCPVACQSVTPFTASVRNGGGIIVAEGTPNAWAQAVSELAMDAPIDRIARRRQAEAAYNRWRERRWDASLP